MKKNSLLRYKNNIIRILEIENKRILIINCTQKTMPKWIEVDKFYNTTYTECTEEELQEETNVVIQDIDSLDCKSKRFIHEHYTLIAAILPFISDEKERSRIITTISNLKNTSKQTIRHYLCLYLIYQNISVLAPKQQTQQRTLTKDEKNIRWALNKYYYTQNKNSLHTAYVMMLKEKYCDTDGSLVCQYPSIHQFKYFYRKHKNLRTHYISRDGIKNYQRNNRPLLGDGIQEFAHSIGFGMLDATICDIYLINESGGLVGRPILTACVDAYSGLCCGYSLSWEGGVYSLRSLMLNVITDKKEWCKKFGIDIDTIDWNCDKLPATLVTDMGKEYASSTFEQITDLGVTIVNLPPYRPELKGAVEKFFDIVQNLYKPYLKGRGVIQPDFQERGAHDYRKDACLTMNDFEKIILHCIIHYNTKQIRNNFPYTEKMIAENIKPFSNYIWNYELKQMGANLISTKYETLVLTLLPRTTGKFSRKGLIVNKLRYKNDNYTEQFLKGGIVTIAYNPENVSEVWLIDNGNYIKFTLIESRFHGKDIVEVSDIKEKQQVIINADESMALQAKIDLANHISAVVENASKQSNINIKGIRYNRKREQQKSHIDYVESGV